MLEAIIFDFDGTLAPTLKRQESWFRFYTKRNNIVWPFENFGVFREFYTECCARPGNVQNVYDDLKLPCDMGDRNHPVWPAYEEFKEKNPQKLYYGMKKTLIEIWNIGMLSKDISRNKRLKFGLNSSNSWKTIRNDLNTAGVLPMFDCFVTEDVLRMHGSSEGLKKPSPFSNALTLDLLRVNGRNTLHVADTIDDLRASHNIIRAGRSDIEFLKTVGALYGYEGEKMLKKGYKTEKGVMHFDHYIKKPSELIQIVKELL